MVPGCHNVHKYYIKNKLLVGYGDITPSTLLGRFIGVFVCLIGVFILSLIVVTLTLFIDLDKDEVVAFNEISSLSHSYESKKNIDNYIGKLIISRIKYNQQKSDLNCVHDKYYKSLHKSSINIELKKNRANTFTYSQFCKNMSNICETRLEPILTNFEPIIHIEDNVFYILIFS
jgi:hypothetical protein